MKLSDIIDEDIDERDEANLVVDFDSIIYLSAYRYRESDDEELAYMDCFKRLYAIEREVYTKYKLDDIKIAMTMKTNFRNKIYDKYKDNRSNKNEEAEKLAELVKRVKALIYKRLKPILLCSKELEADDWCISYSREKGYIVSAIDSDVVSQSSTPVFNFHKNHWKFVHKGLSDKEVFLNIVRDSIKGKAKDNVKGVKGKGEVFANKFIKDNPTFDKWIELYDIPDDALLNFRLCDCRQYRNGKLEMATIKSIANEFEKFS